MDAWLHNTARYIARLQLPSGAIPWFVGGITDPWDHVEALMGLNVAGEHNAALRALDWLAATQRDDGAWLAAYQDCTVVDDTRAETNFVAYAVTGLWHAWLCNRDDTLLRDFWPMAEAAIDFVLERQSPHGEIYWAEDTRTGTSRDALLTGCSSIYKSLECMIRIAHRLQRPADRYIEARNRLGTAIREKPERFDRTWASKARFSMDWFYPVLTGAVEGAEAPRRLDARWSEFVEDGLGCRCVNDEPWVTVAETCELVMACAGSGRRATALQLFAQLRRFQLEDGAWWTGYVFTDRVHWPDERPSWTAAAVLLAADTLWGLSGGQALFLEHLPESTGPG